jgi:DNA protecting protein DprA
MVDERLFELAESASENAPNVPFDRALLGLGMIEGLGHASLKKLVTQLGENIGAVFDWTEDKLLELFALLKMPNPKLATTVYRYRENMLLKGRADLADLAEAKVELLSPSQIPPSLTQLGPLSPQWLFVVGNKELLYKKPAVAVVGTREASAAGVRATSIIAKVMSPYPIVAVSGLAEGIDNAAHRWTISEGIPNIAFLGHGIKKIFPTKTADTREMILEQGGAVVTEYLPDDNYCKRYFVERNRLQAGLADMVIPVEAKTTGGTMHTVTFSRQFKKPLVGIKLNGSSDLVSVLTKHGFPILDIFTKDGCKALDGMFRALVEQTGAKANPLAKMEQRLRSEIQSRDVRTADIQHLIETLRQLMKEPPSNGTP